MIRNDTAVVFLGLGSNLGERENNLSKAIQFLSERMRIEKLSPIYDTQPVGELNQPRFLNMVCRVTTRLQPPTLLTVVKGIEAKLGRVPVLAPRPIDIDILFYSDQVIKSPELTVPHPRIAERAFVLVPLADIAPDFVHPVLKKSTKQLLEEVGGKDGIVKWADALK